MGYTLAFLQKNPKSKAACIGLFSLASDGRVWVQTKTSFVPYKATLVTDYGDVIMSDCETFLRELARQSKLSQITYYYTESDDLAEEYKALLVGG